MISITSREEKENLFSKEFRSILDSITPSVLEGFESSTVQLLLEVCYSYLTHEELETQLDNSEPMKHRVLGISILDSVVTFVLTTNNHSDDR